VSAITAATCGSLLWDDHLQVSWDISRRRLLCCGETDSDARWRNADKCLMPHVSKRNVNGVLCLHRWDGLRQAVCLHKCLYYFVHDHQIWVGMHHLQLSGANGKKLQRLCSFQTLTISYASLQVKTLQCFVLNGFIFLGRYTGQQACMAYFRSRDCIFGNA
jgi:hypothetical protein